MARCINYVNDNQWREIAAPEVNITRSGFDTVTLKLQKPVRYTSIFGVASSTLRYETIDSFPVGARGDGVYRNMWITSNQITEPQKGLLNALITYTGIYQNTDQGQSRSWLNGDLIISKQLFKPVQTNMRCYADKITERTQEGQNYILTIPRLTLTEEYVTEDNPDNTEIGKQGIPLQPPTEVTLPPLPSALAFDTIPVLPQGWILNTRSWQQLLDNPLYHVTDEWQYQIPNEYVNIVAE